MPEPNARFKAQSPILTTSLRIPQPHEGLITRTVLMEKMDQVLDFPLGLISAPVGFGKTTLLSQWISVRTHTNLKDRVAWVSLESEYDVRQFWIYITTSLQEVHPEIGEAALIPPFTPHSPFS